MRIYMCLHFRSLEAQIINLLGSLNDCQWVNSFTEMYEHNLVPKIICFNSINTIQFSIFFLLISNRIVDIEWCFFCFSSHQPFRPRIQSRYSLWCYGHDRPETMHKVTYMQGTGMLLLFKWENHSSFPWFSHFHWRNC